MTIYKPKIAIQKVECIQASFRAPGQQHSNSAAKDFFIPPVLLCLSCVMIVLHSRKLFNFQLLQLSKPDFGFKVFNDKGLPLKVLLEREHSERALIHQPPNPAPARTFALK